MIVIVVTAFFMMLNSHYKTKLIPEFSSQNLKRQKMKLLKSIIFAASNKATMTASEASLADIKRYRPITLIKKCFFTKLIEYYFNLFSATPVQLPHPMSCSTEAPLSLVFLIQTVIQCPNTIFSITSMILERKWS